MHSTETVDAVLVPRAVAEHTVGRDHFRVFFAHCRHELHFWRDWDMARIFDLKDTTIRRAGQPDAAAVRALTRSAYAKWVPLIGREPMPMTADYERAVREHMIDLLFVDAGLAALIETVNEIDHLLIENVAVAPPFQGRGYGRLLLDHAERLAASLRLPELKLYTNKRFVTNIELSSPRLCDRP
jgi:GNAT superfamily N-acetyltransferase